MITSNERLPEAKQRCEMSTHRDSSTSTSTRAGAVTAWLANLKPHGVSASMAQAGGKGLGVLQTLQSGAAAFGSSETWVQSPDGDEGWEYTLSVTAGGYRRLARRSVAASATTTLRDNSLTCVAS